MASAASELMRDSPLHWLRVCSQRPGRQAEGAAERGGRGRRDLPPCGSPVQPGESHPATLTQGMPCPASTNGSPQWSFC